MATSLTPDLLRAIHRLARALPPLELERLVSAVGVASTAGSLSPLLPLPEQRRLLEDIFRQWPEAVPMGTLAVALQSAAYAIERERRAQQVELVWTGPTKGVSFRRTDQALLQVIEAARRSLYMVTFVAYSVPEVVDALSAALDRGVRVRFVAETPDTDKVSFSATASLGALASRVEVYVWPKDKRDPTPAGKIGALHAKCALADDRLLLVSSANLTNYALSRNMEMGILVTGGDAPRRVHEHLERLVVADVLQMV